MPDMKTCRDCGRSFDLAKGGVAHELVVNVIEFPLQYSCGESCTSVSIYAVPFGFVRGEVGSSTLVEVNHGRI